eukprot:CAMPEP_0170076978 /NCGR_PEP_ID=MMETSP0019_2-20121128/13881_1 /TAXON_ID=98059 /ORGANISM="Dinobryon sp., Strain UTEXLB2267" /LENGTH=245 /DNA_ID=CAMNT_0010289019 /DNA_START=258 /DNA_END=995 /DNA_ORIENTATION=+
MQSCESSILPTIPMEVYLSFQDLCRQYVPRLSIISVTIHLMMLVPTLKYIKSNTDISITPFFYLGPIIFMIPFGVLFLWENNLIQLRMVDAKLRQMVDIIISKSKKLANDKEKIDEFNRMFLDISRFNDLKSQTELNDLLKKQAYVRLIAKMDADSLCNEVMALKLLSNKNRKVIATTSSQSSSSPSNILPVRGERGGDRDASVASAVQLLLSRAEAQGQSKTEVLEELKNLQRDLQASSNSNSS